MLQISLERVKNVSTEYLGWIYFANESTLYKEILFEELDVCGLINSFATQIFCIFHGWYFCKYCI